MKDLSMYARLGRSEAVMPSPGSCGHQGLTLIQCHVSGWRLYSPALLENLSTLTVAERFRVSSEKVL
jgi:hypothetical protein